jgi:small subunit ribosomal protein S16
MVKLRLERIGKKHQPIYRLVVIKAKSKRSTAAIEYIGFYDPTAKPKKFDYDKEKVEYWLGVGAQPTDTVRYLLAKEGLVEKVEKKYSKESGQQSKDRAKAKIDKAEAAKEAKKAAKAEKAAAKEETPAEVEVEEVAAESTQEADAQA